jgi:hypothetical protein
VPITIQGNRSSLVGINVLLPSGHWEGQTFNVGFKHIWHLAVIVTMGTQGEEAVRVNCGV